MSQPRVRRARSGDLARIKELLELEALPAEGVAEHLEHFLVAELDGQLVGSIGLELFGDTALLRSAVVSAPYRSRGVGTLLYDTILRNAKARGVRRLVLLTTTAEEYFQRKGFHKVERSTIQGPITRSTEFTGTCPSTAVCMQLII